MFHIHRSSLVEKEKPSLDCKIFETMISQILSYSSEILGVYVKHDFTAWDDTPIEKKKPLEFCKLPQTPHSDRFCPVCNSGIIEDEFNFLLHCPKYSIRREKFYNTNPTKFCRF